MKTLLYAGAAFHLAFAIFHLWFWKLFRWRDELARLGFINRQIVQILNLCLTFVFFAVAWLSFAYADELLAPGLGRALLGAIALFWFARAALQVIFFGLREPVSAALFAAFLGGSALYAIPLFGASA